MIIVCVIDLLAVLIDVGLLTLYFHIFFPRKNLSKFAFIATYIIAAVIYYCSSIYLSEAYQRTIAYLGVCFLLSQCYQGAITHKLVVTFIYASIGVLIETMVSFIFPIINMHLHFNFTNETDVYLIGLVVSNILFFIIVWCMWSFLKEKLQRTLQETYLVNSYWDLLFFVLILITIIISYGISYSTIKQGMANGLFFFFLLEFLLVIFDIVIFVIFKEMEHLQQEKMQAALLKQQNEAQEAFYKESIQKNQQLKEIIHDEKNFLLGLIGLLQNQQINRAIVEMENKIDQLVGNITDYTGIISLDTVLTAKVEQAAQAGIALRPAIALYGEIYIEFLDLVVLLGNALDNAIEATKQVMKEEKVIHVTMKLQDDFLLLEVRNPVCKKVKIQNNWIITSKQDSYLHGLGLSNMKRVTNKYNGTMLLNCSETVFELKILMENECD